MSTKLFKAFRETLKVDEGQSPAERVEDKAVDDRPCGKTIDTAEQPRQVRRPEKPCRYSFAPY